MLINSLTSTSLCLLIIYNRTSTAHTTAGLLIHRKLSAAWGGRAHGRAIAAETDDDDDDGLIDSWTGTIWVVVERSLIDDSD